ncbi:ATP-binding protein [Hydrogenophaga sp. UC242_53]|uniref:hybrid sensor histidine kinase/response regulator n=1 Tax=Hydrogenophaga sp. UC242_53 TaxID=3350170 RepID=UPI0036D3F62F
MSILTEKQPDEATAQRLYAMMDRQVTHMVRLIDDLMEVSRITRGKIELRLAPISLDRVVRDAAELSKPLLAAGRHELELDLPPMPCTVQGDGVRLTQVFANLLNNAAKFTPPQGRIVVSLRSDGRTARVQVRDSGVGIPPAMLGSVFDMFVQISDTSRVAQGGLGIGLTLVRSLVELHGGRVTASSPGVNEGTTMMVELPLVSDEAQQVTADTLAAHRRAGQGHRVLVVDDNRDAADSLAELLGLMGASTSVAYGVDEALAAMEACPPTIAFVDIGMPVRDGYELAGLVRADSALADTVLVALTGWGQATDRERIMAAGFDHHLIKPADLEQLTELLATRR